MFIQKLICFFKGHALGVYAQPGREIPDVIRCERCNTVLMRFSTD